MVAAVLLAAAPSARGADALIRLNFVGFLPNGVKRATVAMECTTFRIVREPGGAEVLTGRAGPMTKNEDTGETVAVVDFSALRDPGVYRLEVPGVGRSPPITIAADVYDQPYHTAMRAMYLWRCGTAVSGEFRGETFSHKPCHLEDAWLDYVGGGRARRDVTGGWHDAGDYNKYAVNAGFTLGVLFQTWEHFGDKLAGVSLDIPESSNATPDFLDELRWGLEWLLKMQADDGSVYHKVSTLKFGPFVLPEDEKEPRYLTPWSSAATADFVAVMAMAERHFEKYDKEFAARCLAAARKSHGFLAARPQNQPADLTGFDTGPYQANDANRRTWAAVEMWETTGEATFLKEFETRASALDRKVDATASWANVKNLGMYTYALSKREGKDPALLAAVRDALVATADEIMKTRDAHGYGRPLGKRYYWGCNGDVAQQVQTLHVANLIRPNAAYTNTSLDALGHLLGRNVYGRSYVTGVGYMWPMATHDRRCAVDNAAETWPGHLVGGPWPKATDWRDETESYQTNEIAINWNATLIYALARFAEGKPPQKR